MLTYRIGRLSRRIRSDRVPVLQTLGVAFAASWRVSALGPGPSCFQSRRSGRLRDGSSWLGEAESASGCVAEVAGTAAAGLGNALGVGCVEGHDAGGAAHVAALASNSASRKACFSARSACAFCASPCCASPCCASSLSSSFWRASTCCASCASPTACTCASCAFCASPCCGSCASFFCAKFSHWRQKTSKASASVLGFSSVSLCFCPGGSRASASASVLGFSILNLPSSGILLQDGASFSSHSWHWCGIIRS